MEEEYKTYQPRWEERKEREEKKAQQAREEQDGHHHHHHGEHHHHHDHDHRDHYYSSGSHNESNFKRSNRLGGWLKENDKQAYYGLMLVVVVAVCFAVYAIVSAFAEEIRHMPGKEDAEGFKVDELRIKKVDEADALLFGDSLARELKMDTLVHTVTGAHHNVYRPPKKSKSDLMDGREWNGLFKNLRRWFKANKGDPKLIIFLVLFGLGIISLAGYGIWKRKHPHGREDY